MKSWVRIDQTEGRLTPSQTAKLKPDKLERETLRREVQEHPESFQSEHAKTFGVVQSTLSKAFQQLGLIRKKTNPYAKADEEHEKVLGKIPGKREPQFNFIALLNSSQLKAPLIYQGTMNTRLFNTYREKFL